MGVDIKSIIIYFIKPITEYIRNIIIHMSLKIADQYTRCAAITHQQMEIDQNRIIIYDIIKDGDT
jgi:hypothetical protein